MLKPYRTGLSGPYQDQVHQPAGHQSPPAPAAPSAQEAYVTKFVEDVLAKGEVPGSPFLSIGIHSNREKYLEQCLENERLNYAASRVGQAKESYVLTGLNLGLNNPETLRLAEAANRTYADVVHDIGEKATESWKQLAQPHLEEWDRSPQLRKKTMESAERRWNELAAIHATLLASEAYASSHPKEAVPASAMMERRSVGETLRERYTRHLKRTAPDAELPPAAHKPSAEGDNRKRKADDAVGSPSAAPEAKRPASGGRAHAGSAQADTPLPPGNLDETGVAQIVARTGIPSGRRKSVTELITATLHRANRMKIMKTSKTIENHFRRAAQAIATKDGKERFDVDEALEAYRTSGRHRIKHKQKGR